jgi:hypothetical protein
MPAKKTQITDAERAANMRKLAREVEADNDPASLDKALRKIVERGPEGAKVPSKDRATK